MSEQILSVQCTASFREQIEEHGFAGPVELLLSTVRAQIQQGLPNPSAEEIYWFERKWIPSDKQFGDNRIWLGARLEDGVLILREVRTEDPGP